MSNIYILEPPTSGKVLLKTTAGDIDVELWAKETPKTCRNFIQLCLEGYYDNLTFHRIVRGFIAQGGDPNGDGSGGESIYGAPFKDEFHQRLRFARRGLLAMANAGKDDNGSQFFFTLSATPELQNKHTIFGKITGDTVFNMLKLEDGDIVDETPEFPHKILKTEVLNNPFTDIEPRVKQDKVHDSKDHKVKKTKEKGVKDYKLLSFGEEAEEDEVETSRANEKYSGKSKSTHDLLNDPKLSSESDQNQKDTLKSDSDDTDNENDALERSRELDNIKNKLSMKKEKKKADVNAVNDDSDINEYYLNKDRNDERKKKMEEIKKEIATVKKDYQSNKVKQQEAKVDETEAQKSKAYVQEYALEYGKYVDKKKDLPAKGSIREQQTLELLAKFKTKLASAKENAKEQLEDDDNVDDEQWMSHELKFKSDDPILAKDANTKEDDWFEIYDPRNPLNKRRRGEVDNPTKRKK